MEGDPIPFHALFDDLPTHLQSSPASFPPHYRLLSWVLPRRKWGVRKCRSPVSLRTAGAGARTAYLSLRRVVLGLVRKYVDGCFYSGPPSAVVAATAAVDDSDDEEFVVDGAIIVLLVPVVVVFYSLVLVVGQPHFRPSCSAVFSVTIMPPVVVSFSFLPVFRRARQINHVFGKLYLHP